MLAMKHKTLFAIALPLAVFALSLSSAAKTQVELKDAQGKTVGRAIMWDHNPGGGVGIELNLHDLPPGEHALQFHQNAKCDPPDFKSAGPHFNSDGKKHGVEDSEGYQAGEMENFTVGPDGKA